MWAAVVTLASCLSVVALHGCGRDVPQADPIIDQDAEVEHPRYPCNPVTQTGCRVGRCTWDFYEARTWCDDDPGSVAVGQACAISTRGFDDCRSGGICIEGLCREICGVYAEGDANSCTSPTTCDDISPIFADENAVLGDVLGGAGACAL